jgi:hypothetical protein
MMPSARMSGAVFSNPGLSIRPAPGTTYESSPSTRRLAETPTRTEPRDDQGVCANVGGVRCVWLCASVCAHEDGYVCPAPAVTWYPSDCTCPCLRVCTISATRRFFCSAWYELRRAMTACHVDLTRSHGHTLNTSTFSHAVNDAHRSIFLCACAHINSARALLLTLCVPPSSHATTAAKARELREEEGLGFRFDIEFDLR